MKEFIKTLDNLRPEDIRFPFDPLNKNLCFGGGPPKPPKIKIGGSAGEILDAGKAAADKAAADAKAAKAAAATKAREAAHAAASKTKANAMGLATDARAELHRVAAAGRAFAHAAADQVKTGMQKIGLHKSDDDSGDSGETTASAAPGQSETVGASGSKVSMKEAEAAKGKKAKMGAKGKRALRKVGAQ